jgi:hypothetical protein
MSRKNRALYDGGIITTSKNIANKRIPVTEKVWKSLHNLRKPGQTYNELIESMIPVYEYRDIPDYGDIIILESAGDKEKDI